MRPYWQNEARGLVIYHADCREVLPQLRGSVVLTDPPYNCGKQYGEETDDRRPWPEWCDWWDEILEMALAAAPDVLAFLSQTAYRQYLRLGRVVPAWSLVWVKPLSLAVCALPFMPHWEPIAYWGETRRTKGHFWGSDVVTCNVTPNQWGHPTEKPLALMRDLVRRFDGPIIDPFLGSGTTLRAAQELGRPAMGIEISERWCEVAAHRLEKWTQEPDEQMVMPMEGLP